MSPSTNAHQRLQSLYRRVLLRLRGGEGSRRRERGSTHCMEELPPRLMFSFTPAGSEFDVNTVTSGRASTAVVAMSSSGAFVVVWQANGSGSTGWDIYAQLYNSSGVAQGGNILVNQTTNNDQTEPAVAMDSAGAFAVTWMSNQAPQTNIIARVFSAAGTALTNEIDVSNVAAPIQAADPTVAMNATGSFVVAYDTQGGPPNNQSISSQSFNSSGVATDNTQSVYEAGAGPAPQSDPALAMNDSGAYVVAWTSQSGPQGKIYGQLYASGGIADGSPFLVGTSGNFQEATPTAGMDSAGNFTIAWSEQVPGPNNEDILARQFNAAGTELQSTPIAVNTYTNDTQSLPSLSELSNGQFAVAWESNNEDGAGSGIYAQVFTASGIDDGGQFQVNTSTHGNQEAPHLAWVGTTAVIAWDGKTASDPNGIAAQRFYATSAQVDQAPTLTVPPAQSIDEDDTLTFSTGNNMAVTAADSDADGGTEQITLTATHGTISLETLSNISLVSGTGTDDTTVAIQGQLADLNAAMNGMKFTPTSGFSGSAALAVSIDDLGNTGSGGPLTTTRSIAITIAAVLHTPTVSNATTTENHQSSSGLVITPDSADAGLDDFEITGITGGTLYLNDGATQIVNWDAISSAQGEAGLKFTPTANSTATGSFDVQAVTLLGLGGLAGDVVPVTVKVTPVPTLTVPSGQTTKEGNSLTFASTSNNAITVSDPGNPGGTGTFTLIATGGTITLPNDSQVTLNSGTGVNDTLVTFTGTLSELNTALGGMIFTSTSNTYGSAAIQAAISEQGSAPASGNISITVNRIAHTPTVSNANTTENVQTTTGLVITPNSLDSSMSGYFEITGITGGTLFQNNGTGQINNGAFITFAQGEAGLKFTPNTNTIPAGGFTVQASTTGSAGGLGGSTATADITVTGTLILTLPMSPSTNEDQTLSLNGNAISVSDPGAPNATVTVTLAASGGTVSLGSLQNITVGSGTGSNDSTVRFTGSISAVNAATAGMTFQPTAHTYGSASIAVTATEGSNTSTGNAAISVNRLAHAPTVTNATTDEDFQTTSGLVITPNTLDSGLSGYFKITGITAGSLYQNDGSTSISNGQFITFAQGEAGLKWAPTSGSTASGSFSIQASTTNSAGGLGGSVISASITVNPDAGPTVSAGNPQSTSLPNTLTLAGSVTESPLGPGLTLSSIWTKLSGPGNVAFGNAASTTSTATFSQPGSYVLKLTGSDGDANNAAQVTISVVAAPQLTVPPAQSISEDATLTLAGSDAISVADPDNSGATATVTLSTTGGMLALASVSQLTIGNGTGIDDSSVTFTGTLSAVNAAMDGLVFTPTHNSFGTTSIAVTATEGSFSSSGSVAVVISRVAHTPSVTNASALENGQSTSGLVITPSALDQGLAGYFRIGSIVGGALYQNDGVTPITNGAIITFAEGEAGLKFTPTANSGAPGSFTVQASRANNAGGLGGTPVSAAVTVTPVPMLAIPSVQSIREDIPLTFSPANGNAIGVSDPAAPGGTATVALTATDGTITLPNIAQAVVNSGTGMGDSAVTFTGTFAALNSVLNGMIFTPSLHTYGNAGLAIDVTEGSVPASGNIAIAISRVAHTPSVTDAATFENTQSTSGLVITPDVLDQGLAGYFQISGIAGGKLFVANGRARIEDGQFISFAEGAAGLSFSPTTGSVADGSFTIAAAAGPDTADLGGDSIVATVVVSPLALIVKSASLSEFYETSTVIRPNALQVLRTDASQPDITFQIVSLPENGELRLGGVDLTAGSTFTSANVGQGDLQYLSDSAAAEHDSFEFTASDPEGATLGAAVFSITLQHPYIPPQVQPAPISPQSAIIPTSPADSPANPTPASSKDSGSTVTPARVIPVAPTNASSTVSPSNAPGRTGPLNVALEAAVPSGLKQSVSGIAVDKLISTGPVGVPTQAAASAELTLLGTALKSNADHSNLTAMLDDSGRLGRDLDSMQEKMSSNTTMRVWAGTASVFSIGLPVVYLAYAVRAGTLVSSLMSSIPGWSIVDPLPILNEMSQDDDLLGDQEEDKGLHDLVEKDAEEPTDAT